MKRPPLRPVRLIIAALLVAIAFKFFILDLALVAGPSMLPTLAPGRIVLVLRLAYGLRLPPGLSAVGRGGHPYLLRWSSPRPGSIVVARNPESGTAIIKRVAAPEAIPVGIAVPDSAVFLLGDNPAESLDSREYGPVPVEEIAGRVLGWP
jgi:signal peptidase I